MSAEFTHGPTGSEHWAMVEPAIEQIRIDAASPDAAEEPISILIVDDEPSNLVVLETVLDDPSYRLVRAQSADQALLALVREEFALLILDIRMPGMTGFELAALVKERKKTAGVPIIFLTAYYDTDQQALEGYGTGAVDFLSKPVNPAVLRSKVSVFADLHRKTRALTVANCALRAEVDERRRAEEQLRDLNHTLEQRVIERTEALHQTDRQLREMMGSITDGLLMLDRDWRFTYANDEAARLLGMPAERLRGARLWELFPHTLNTLSYDNYHRALATRQTLSFEEFYPEPVNKWFQCHCYPSDAGLSVYFLDITDRREVDVRRERLLAAEQAARAEGERLARAKDEFLASLSHELRTPLAAIIGWTSVLQRSPGDPQTVQRGIEVIARNAKAQSQLVADLLDVSRIVSGKLRMNVERVDLNLIAATAADTGRPAAHAKGITIETRLAHGAATEIVGDIDRLHQIASNLVANALKFTPVGGVVTLSTAVTESHVELEVVDTGAGIAAEFLPHLFERFSQADVSAARLHGGLGLGLSIVKNLLELHGGTVTAHSGGVGQGSSFKVRFPRANGFPALQALLPLAHAESGDTGVAMLDDGAAADIDLRGVSVLLVDDHDDVLEVERRLLAECGARVTTATSAEQALRSLRSEHFDVLLSDLGMPGMDGFALIRGVRTVLGLDPARLPAAAVTAFVRAEDRQQALHEGYQAVVQKPVSPSALARAVVELLSGRRAEAANELLDGGADAHVPARSRLRALFVEDNLDLQEQIGWLLEEEGLDLVICANGEDAAVEFAQGGFDLVVTDVSLPRMSGIDFAKRVLAEAPHAWVIFSTGYPMGDRLTRDLGPNVRALLKPFESETLHQLMDEVRAALGRTR